MSSLLSSDEPKPTYTKGFWIGLVIGVPVVAYGVLGAIDNLPGVQLTSFFRYFAGGAVAHDLVFAPIVCLVAFLAVRVLPKAAVAPVQAALVISAIVAIVSWPFVRGYGITAGEPTFLSRNYAASVLTVWAVTWSVTAVAVAVRLVRARRS